MDNFNRVTFAWASVKTMAMVKIDLASIRPLARAAPSTSLKGLQICIFVLPYRNNFPSGENYEHANVQILKLARARPYLLFVICNYDPLNTFGKF